MSEPILVTGAAGFIGFHLARRLLDGGATVTGLDNLNAYYDPAVKRGRLALLTPHERFRFEEIDLADRDAMARLFAQGGFTRVVHLGAQAGVRYSIDNPSAYVDSNLVGFGNVLEGCRRNGCRHLVYASSSSVYGANTRQPFRVTDAVDHPLSFYAATKKANELMAHTYAHLFGIPTTGLRFFTVYGPWGRPDMAAWIFTRAILAGEPIRLFNHGRMRRDFTYIDDVVDAVIRLVDRPATPDPSWSGETPSPATSAAPWRVYNIGDARPTELMRVVEILEGTIGREAIKRFEPAQPGDLISTAADVADLAALVDFRPRVPIEEGLPRFVAWYRRHFGA